ncbi:outer membrane protein assembly factor [Pendulispora rubella]|uniref:Outer membrane protein assembly factor n=1 Tax=Pendulispora rubella TaxID=2741070 RepID=A0ABZ2L975_9BACT
MRLRYAIAMLLLLVAALSVRRASAQQEEEPGAVKEPKTDFNAAPIVGGSSDIGIVGGALAAVTRLAPQRAPYLWRLEANVLATFKVDPRESTVQLPYQDYYLMLTLPHLVGNTLRLEIRPSFTREMVQRYYGIGNASPATTPGGPEDSGSEYYQYGRMHPTLLVRAKLRLGGAFFLLLGNSFTYNQLDVSSDSKLAADMARGTADVRQILGDTRAHAVDLFEYGVFLDTRDNEIHTTRGMFHQIKLRLSPGGIDSMPYRYAQVNVTARGYLPIGSRIVVAGRLVGDVQFGDVPFYELTRYEDTFAIGGSNGVRGVPGQRYYGKVKAFGNLEVRASLFDFRLFKKRFSFGVAAFFDAGRVWTELGRSHPDLDGTGPGIKYGTGGGLRLRQGKTFVLRADVAWSPDATPVGGYFTMGEMF